MESTINEIKVNGIDYVRKGTQKEYSGEVKIAILQRGWIFVGYYSKTAQDCKLSSAKCIRNWGTTKGLGELAQGPTSKTVLDGAGTVRFNEATIIALIDADESKWSAKL